MTSQPNATTPVDTHGSSGPTVSNEPGAWAAFRAMYALILRNQLTRGRVLALGTLGIVGIIVAVVATNGAEVNTTVVGTRFVNSYGLSLLTPVVALVFGAGALGDLIEDRSLVYLWMPPVPRSIIALAAWGATLTACIPFGLLAVTGMAAATTGGADLIIGTFWASLIAIVAYSGIFTALGLRFKRALLWGLVYLLIWESFIARAGDGAARLSVLSYARSVLSAYTGVGLTLADRALNWAFAIPVAVGIAGVAYTVRRLHTTDVD